MSSDSSEPSKNNVAKNSKQIYTTRKLNDSSEDSEDRQTSRGSKESQKSNKSIPHSKVTVLEQLSLKNTVDLYGEERHRVTATTHNSTAPTVITAVLRDLQDDIVRSSDYRPTVPAALVNGDRAIAVIGGDNIYVQSKNKFIPVPRNKAVSTNQDHRFWPYSTSKLEDHSPLDVAVVVQKVFTPVSSICFGLLGGVALLQLILVDNFVGGVNNEDQKSFLQCYPRVAEITPLLFYILLAVCIVSVLDRVGLQGEGVVCQRSWIVVGVYVLILFVTLSCAPYDDLLTLYPQNKTLFQDPMKTQEMLSSWQLLNNLRCLLAVLGWVLYSLISPPDFLLQHLLHIKQYEQDKHPSSAPVTDSLP